MFHTTHTHTPDPTTTATYGTRATVDNTRTMTDTQQDTRIKIEDELVFANPDKDSNGWMEAPGRNHPARRRRWHWLSAPDGSYETVRGFHNSTIHHRIADRNSSNGTDDDDDDDNNNTNEGNLTYKNDDGVKSENNACPALLPPVATAAVKTEPVKPMPEPVQPSWHWLLNPDGSYATIDSSAERTTTTTTAASRMAATAVEPTGKKRKQRDPAEAGSENETKEGSKSSSWHWLLAPDGSYATAGNKKERERIESRMSPIDKRSNGIHRKRNAAQSEKSWYWLLAPDGTPATIEHSLAASRASSSRKRNRSGVPDDEKRTFEQQRTRRRPTGSKTLERFDAEEDDESRYDVDADFVENRSESNVVTEEQHEKWENLFRLLVQYKKKHRTTLVPGKQNELGIWVMHQRRAYRTGKLTKYRQECLESIGFVWDVRETEWMKMYHSLLAYREQNGGSTHVPSSTSRSDKYYKLALWVKQQRVNRSSGRLSDERYSLLESIGFCWHISQKFTNKNKKDWMVMYRRLIAYKEKYKSTDVPTNFNGDPKLGKWVVVQRRTCREADRIDLLNYIGFEWNPLEKDWMDMYNRLLAYQEKYKNTRVPKNFKADPKLGEWVSTQRRCCAQKEHIDRLNAIGFEWNPLEDRWMEMYKRLLAYQKKYKTTRVPSTIEGDRSLSHWVHTQRKRCTRKDRIDLLNDIGFDWDRRVK